MKLKQCKVVVAFLCICALLLAFAFTAFNHSKYNVSRASKLLDTYQQDLEDIATYMLSTSPKGQYLDSASHPDSYLNCSFLPDSILEDMTIYFRKIAPHDFGSINALREDTLWYWNLDSISSNQTLVSFTVFVGEYASDSETGNSLTEYQMLYYSKISEGDLKILLSKDVLHIYEISKIKDNWYLVTRQ